MKKYTTIFANLSLLGTFTFIALVLLLHFLRNDLYFFEHFVSEYAIGKFGWIQTIAFFSLSIGQLFLLLGLKANVKTSIFSMIFLIIWCVSLFLVAIFPTNLPNETPSTINNIHNLAALFAFLSLAIAMITWAMDFKKKYLLELFIQDFAGFWDSKFTNTFCIGNKSTFNCRNSTAIINFN